MKTHCNLVKIFLLISTISLSHASLGFAEDKTTGGVTIKKEAITVHAGTKLSKDDEKALNDVLKKYDKKLYLVQEFQKGRLTKSMGELKVNDKLESELAKAKMVGSTDSTVVFSPSGCRVVPESRTFTQKEDAKKLVQELKPILAKYSKQ
jgi:hypothetical protein